MNGGTVVDDDGRAVSVWRVVLAGPPSGVLDLEPADHARAPKQHPGPRHQGQSVTSQPGRQTPPHSLEGSAASIPWTRNLKWCLQRASRPFTCHAPCRFLYRGEADAKSCGAVSRCVLCGGHHQDMLAHGLCISLNTDNRLVRRSSKGQLTALPPPSLLRPAELCCLGVWSGCVLL